MKLLTALICVLIPASAIFSQKLTIDTSFAPALNGSVNFLEVLSDGKTIIAGDFTLVNGTARRKLARLNSDGSLDASFDTGWLNASTITSMKILPNGKILIAGDIYVSSSGAKILRLNADGSYDATMTSNPFISYLDSGYVIIRGVNQLPNGKILMCGKFTLPNGNSKPYLARYNNDGTYDSTFATVIGNECHDVAVQPDGKYLVAGYYSTVNGNPAQSLTRFNADDSIDTSFNAAPISGSEQTIYKNIKLQSDGKILAFRAPGCCTYAATRFNSDGSVHTNFSTSIRETGDFALQSNGKITIVSEFDGSVFGQSNDLNRFNTNGTHDPSLNRMNFYGSDFPVYPKTGAFTADDKLIVGGNFTGFSLETGGTQISRTYLARLLPEAIPVRPRYDFDGDGKDDMAVFRPGNSVWYLNRTTAGFYATQFGISTDIPAAADYDGDGKADIAVFRDGVWYWMRSSDSAFSYRICGQAGDIPTPQYSTAAAALSFNVFRPSTGKFYSQGAFQSAPTVVNTRNMVTLPGDKPVIADYDGDGRDDYAVFRDGNWFSLSSSSSATRHYQFGTTGDKPVIGDFDGDGRNDYAVFRPSNGTWYIQKSTDGLTIVQWGLADDLPVPADYDGDGKTDIAVFRPSNGVWYIIKSAGAYHFEQFGLSGDIPAQLR